MLAQFRGEREVGRDPFVLSEAFVGYAQFGCAAGWGQRRNGTGAEGRLSWRDEIDIALQEWIAASGAERSAHGWRRIGPARRDGAPGHFAVDIRSANLSPDQADDLRLAGPDEEGIPAEGFPVMDSTFDGATLRVRVAEFAAPPEPYLWLPERDRAFLVKELRMRLASLSDAGLAGLLARGEPGGVPSAASPPAWLRDGQADAYRACLGEGLWLVWGPPGTGKTRVLGAAIGDLLAAGKRVLLVSGTNVAVDSALREVLKERQFEPGQIVRVGSPQLTGTAGNPDVCLSLMVRAKLAQAEERRRAAAEDLRSMDGRKERLQRLDAELAGFDPAAYEAAVALLATPAGLVPELNDALAACEEEIVSRAPALEAAREELGLALAAVAEADPVRLAWADVEHLEAGLASVEELVTQAEARALRAKAAADAAAEQAAALQQPDGKVRWRDRRAHADAQQWLTEKLEEYDELYAAAEEARRTAQAARRSTDREIAEREAGAALSRAEILRRDRTAEQARMRVRVLEQAQGTRLGQRVRLREAVNAARDAEDLVSACRQRGWPELRAEARGLRAQIERDSAMRPGVRERHDELQAEYDRMAKDAGGELIKGARLVATTLARFRLVDAVFDGPYDTVLVDEATAAALPEVLLAVAKAGRCAVVLGDFMQPGPVLPEALERGDRAEVRTWLGNDPFGHCGIRTPGEARARSSCLVLDTQHRLGPDVTRLANLLAYDGLLKAGPGVPARAGDDPELILIDTDGLQDLARVQREDGVAGWWPAGALLSRAVAELHREHGEATGVVTPYRVQAEATLAALRDAEAGGAPLAEAGTAHPFQGRQFPVVVFDTVEPEFGPPGWIATATLAGGDSWRRDGVRLFNAAATRVTHRLYVIASGGRVTDAGPGTALGHFAALVRDGRVRGVSAAALVTPPEWEPPDLGPQDTALAQVLARHIAVSDADDEKSFYEQLAALIDEARHSIWIWSPWLANRAYRLLPRLQDAARRGVSIAVFTRDPGGQVPGAEISVTALNALGAVARVVEMNVACQKVIVVDDHTVMMGTLSALSRQHSREVMITVRGQHFARGLLADLHAEAFTAPPACAACGGRDLDLRRGTSGYYWRCRGRACPARGKGTYKAWTQQVDLSPGRAPEPDRESPGPRPAWRSPG